MRIKNKVVEFFNIATRNTMGGGTLCKRVAATVVAVVMAVCGSGVAAWAKPDGPGNCGICGSEIALGDLSSENVSYEEYFGVASLSELSCFPVLYAYEGTNLNIIKHANKGALCIDCLENYLKGIISSGSTQVTAEVASTYSIIVPQAITLDGSGQSGTYSKTFAVTVKGDIGENQQVTVTATPPTMKCAGCADVAATFTGGYKTTWNRSEAAANSYAGTAADYTVSATLTPGEWTGTATFACSLGGGN